ncbi:heme acquisition protein HasA [Yersinia aleksiciae]|uniref:heme acquisition protein HasA n=1 Tax=Yersinia aleksiciae TaxID=263819 RepID=UPI0021BD56AA|nr:heme acquisition protein HasA [Yersinia aleksiciae]
MINENSISISFGPKVGSNTLGQYSEEFNIGSVSQTTTTNNNGSAAETIQALESAKQAEALARMCDCSTNDTVGYEFIGINKNGSCKSDHEMIIKGKVKEGIMYSNAPQHTFYGEIDSVLLGKGFSPGSNGMNIDELHLKFSGLNITSQFDASKTMAENHQGKVHKVIDGLIRGDINPLMEIIQSAGIDMNTAIKDLDIAKPYDSIIDIPMSNTVGVVDDSEALLAA